MFWGPFEGLCFGAVQSECVLGRGRGGVFWGHADGVCVGTMQRVCVGTMQNGCVFGPCRGGVFWDDNENILLCPVGTVGGSWGRTST